MYIVYIKQILNSNTLFKIVSQSKLRDYWSRELLLHQYLIPDEVHNNYNQLTNLTTYVLKVASP